MQTSPEPQQVPAHQHFACDILPCPSDTRHEQCAVATSTTIRNPDEVQVTERPDDVKMSQSALAKRERPLQSASTRSCTVQTSIELTSDDIPTRDSDHSTLTREPLQSEEFKARDSPQVRARDRGAGDASRLFPEKPTFSSAQPLPSRRPHKKRFRRSRTSQEFTEEAKLNSLASTQPEQDGFSQNAAEGNASLSETVPPPASASRADVAQLSRVSVDTLTDVSDVDVSWSFAKSPSKHRQSQERPILRKTAAKEPHPTHDVVVCSESVELRSSQHWQAHSTAATTAVSATVTEVSQSFPLIARNISLNILFVFRMFSGHYDARRSGVTRSESKSRSS